MFRKWIVMGVVIVAGSAWAGRPLAIDDADPVECGLGELEAGVVFEQYPGCKHWDYPVGLAAGLALGIEGSVGFGGQFEERTEVHEESGATECTRAEGLGDLTLGVKWQAIRECLLGARHALALSLKIPTADNEQDLGSGEPDNDITWIVSRSMAEKAGIHFNAGYSWIGGPDADILHYGVAVDYQIANKAQWVGEAFSEKELVGGADPTTQFKTGFRWSPAEDFTWDIAAGSSITGEAPDFIGTVGLTWAFGFHIQKSK